MGETIQISGTIRGIGQDPVYGYWRIKVKDEWYRTTEEVILKLLNRKKSPTFTVEQKRVHKHIISVFL